MPIDRPATEDRPARHWCDPASETPDDDGKWTCPCGQTWAFVPNQIDNTVTGNGLWVRDEELETSLEALVAVPAEPQGEDF